MHTLLSVSSRNVVCEQRPLTMMSSICSCALCPAGRRRTNLKTRECKSAALYGLHSDASKNIYPQQRSVDEVGIDENGVAFIEERHRHRYEVNPTWVEKIEANSPLRYVPVASDLPSARLC